MKGECFYTVTVHRLKYLIDMYVAQLKASLLVKKVIVGIEPSGKKLLSSLFIMLFRDIFLLIFISFFLSVIL